MSTKRDIVKRAFRKAGLAAFVFDLTPDQMNDAMNDMDSMLSTWYGKGINFAYHQNGDLDDESGIPDTYIEAVALNLALIIAPDFGKQIMPEVKTSAKLAYDGLLSKAAMPPEMQLPTTMPLGAGNKPYGTGYNRFVRSVLDPVALRIESNIDYLTEKLKQYEAPTATGFSIQVTDGPASVLLSVDPLEAYSAGTIVMPLMANCVNLQEVQINFTKAVEVLTVDGNGATVVNEPTYIRENTTFILQYSSGEWALVG